MGRVPAGRGQGTSARHTLFLDFTAIADTAHFGTMLVEGLTMTGEHHHLYGDILPAWVLLIPLAAVWLTARRIA